MNRTKIIAVVIITIVIVWMVLGYKLIGIKEQESLYGFHVDGMVGQHTLTSHLGEPFSFSELRGDMKLVNFGYTNCPDICPTTLARLRQVYERIGESREHLDVLFITVDPKRDSVKRLGEFVPYFHEDFIGLTGSDKAIMEVANDFNVHYFKEDVKSEDEYLMSHSPAVFLVNREGKIVLKYPQQMIDPDKMADDIKKLM